MTYIREDQADIRVWLNGIPFGDSWKTAQGGTLEADDQKVRAGGMGKEVSAGGPASRGDLTIGIPFSDVVAGWHPAFEANVGSGHILVGINWLGPDRVPNGHGTTRQGTLKAANLPDHGDGASVNMYEIIVSCDEQAS